jgi:hypothetical protein
MDDVEYDELVPGTRYAIFGAPEPEDVGYDPDSPYMGVFKSRAGIRCTFTDVTDVHGANRGEMTFGANHFYYELVNGAPPNIYKLERRTIPAGSVDVVNQMEIEEGMEMADFQDEFTYGRYYPSEVFMALKEPKLNPMTRQPIKQVSYYIAHLEPKAGRRRRKTKKSKRRMRKTRRSTRGH